MGDYGFDILGFLRQTRGDGGGMLGGYSLAGWCLGWEGASVSKAGRLQSDANLRERDACQAACILDSRLRGKDGGCS